MKLQKSITFFINIGSNLAQLIPQTNYPPEYYINSVDKIFTFREITEEEVLTLLLNMSTNKATGMDSLSIKLVKLSAPLITHAMTVIFNKSIDLYKKVVVSRLVT